MRIQQASKLSEKQRSGSPVKPLILCTRCRAEMRLLGIEPQSETRDLYTFECSRCGQLQVRSVLVDASQRLAILN